MSRFPHCRRRKKRSDLRQQGQLYKDLGTLWSPFNLSRVRDPFFELRRLSTIHNAIFTSFSSRAMRVPKMLLIANTCQTKGGPLDRSTVQRSIIDFSLVQDIQGQTDTPNFLQTSLLLFLLSHGRLSVSRSNERFP